jgi:hypothetical protein
MNLLYRFHNKRLNDTIPLLIDQWLNENMPNMKMILKNKILERVSDKWDHFETLTLF